MKESYVRNYGMHHIIVTMMDNIFTCCLSCYEMLGKWATLSITQVYWDDATLSYK